jgi:2-keto-4-pentenoate hydratase/2-oxohepta-3-ene-1,7-dioic acid hydratase in catechol pathway
VKLVSFEAAGRVATGVLLGDAVMDVKIAAAAAGETLQADTMIDIIASGAPALAALKRLAGGCGRWPQSLLPLANVRLLAPIPKLVRNVFCVGRNYLDHVKEGFAAVNADLKLPEAPQFFTKATHALNGPTGDIRLDPGLTRLLDYEVELAVVIGAGGRDIPQERAYEHVFGYAVCNDITARDLQKRHEQFFKGKSLDTSFPFGPCIVDAEEIGDPATLELSLSVNGEERQRARASLMIFDIPTIIASLSAGLTLEPGDIIATGTPAGVGYAMTPRRRLADGDLIVAAIDRIGELRNKVVRVG